MNIADTHLVEYVPYPLRNERCAVGVLARRHDGAFSMHLGHQLKKAKAINPACNIEALRDGLDAVAAELQQHPEALSLYASGATGIVISPRAGRITYSNEAEFESGINWALSVAVEPTKLVRTRERAPISRLFMEIKNTFDALGWMAHMGQNIDAGMIVPRFALSASEGLVVDFAQQGDQFLAVQTVDYRHNAPAKRIEASAKLLTLGMAEQIIVPHARRIAVFAGTSVPESSAGVHLAERVCNNVFMEESSEDMRQLMDLIAANMGQSSMPVLRTN